MGQKVLKKFDRYLLLDVLAHGGMAEIFRACPATREGVNRFLVIKRILSSQGKNVDFRSMFQSEIKLMMNLIHPNIVQLYDFGEAEGQRFIAMELVDGKNLRQIILKANEQKKPIPPAIVAHIVEQIAYGLHYAHIFKDKVSGEPLGIVHRDVSPQNILVSYDGAVKIVDFGIAKAKSNLDSTRVGIIKGKPSYLSPEQVGGKPLDGRSDVFSLGAVLWEGLTGQKLFAAKQGENEFAVLKQIESADSVVRPPSKLNAQVPPELDAITMKALSKKLDNRYQNAEDFARALRKCIISRQEDVTASVVSDFIKQLFKKDIVEDRRELQDLAGQAKALLEEDVTAFNTQKGPEVTSAGVRARDGTITFFNPKQKSQAKSKVDVSGTEWKRQERHEISGNFFKNKPTAIEVDRSVLNQESNEARSRSYTVSNHTQSKNFGTPVFQRPLFKMITIGLIAIVAGPMVYKTAKRQFLLYQSQDRAPAQVSIPHTKGLKTIHLKLDIQIGVGPTQISINGNPINAENPKVEVPLDEPMVVLVSRDQYRDYRNEFVLSSSDLAGQSEVTLQIPLEPLRASIVSIKSTPSATVTLTLESGQKLVTQTPLAPTKIPAGYYTIRLFNDVLGMEKVEELKAEERQTYNLNYQLEIKR